MYKKYLFSKFRGGSIVFNFIKNIVERYGIWKIILGASAGCLLLFSIYPNLTAPIDAFKDSIALKSILLFIFGYSFSAICWSEAVLNDVHNYILNKKYNSFQTAETVSKNSIDGSFDNMLILGLYSLFSIGPLFLLYYTGFFKPFDEVFFGIMVFIILLIDFIYAFMFKNISNELRRVLIVINLIIWIITSLLLFVILVSPNILPPLYNQYIEWYYLVGLVGGIILFLSFNFYNILSTIENNILIITLLKLKIWLKKVFEQKIINRIIDTNNYDHKIDEPIPLTEDIDCFDTLKKVDVIKEVIYKNILDSYKIIALYGNWGSGKSSVIKILMKELDSENKEAQNIKEFYESKNNPKKFTNIVNNLNNTEEKFITIKFDAWEYENEENIAYVLLNKIIEELEKNPHLKFRIKAIKNEILKSGAIVLKSINIDIKPFNLNFECGSERYDEVENLKNGLNKISNILYNNNKRLIVFIDELDRCERENILKFLASLKLFFTSGDNINYICAVDKEAVAEALEHKYNDGEKAEEYLEKIFNFSFNMPKKFNVEEFIKRYGFNDYYAKKLAKFFEAINFTTPRHLKKVLNKYDYLVKIKTSESIKEDLKNLIPNIIRCPYMMQTSKIKLAEYHYYIKKDKKLYDEYLFDTIFVLYFIILYGFYYEKYLEIKNIDNKLNNYAEHFRHIGWDIYTNENYKDKPITYTKSIIEKYMRDKFNIKFNNVVKNLYEYKTKEEQLSSDKVNQYEFKNAVKIYNSLNSELLKLVFLFTPLITNMKDKEFGIFDNAQTDKIPIPTKEGEMEDCPREDYLWKKIDGEFKSIYNHTISNMEKFLGQFEHKNNEILIDFCKYLISEEFFEIIEKEEESYKNDNENNNYNFGKLFDMVETLL